MSAAIAAAVGGAVVASTLANDNGAEGANSAAADNSRAQTQIALDQWDKYKEIYEPLEKQMVSEAQNYDTPAQYEKAAGKASATVADQFAKARDQLTRTPGVDPSSASYQAGMVGLNLAQAATDATSQNAARQTVQDTAYQRKAAALAMGKGLDSTASAGLASSASLSLSQANAAQAQANSESQAIGSTVGKVVSALPNTGLFGSSASSGSSDYIKAPTSTQSVYTNGQTGATFDWDAL